MELATILFISLDDKTSELGFSNGSLELILTINGLFSAILVTYFFNRITFALDFKKEIYNEAVKFSQKITEFRRICDELTKYYNVWADDKATKSLLEHNEYKHIDYIDYKGFYSDNYKPSKKELEIIEKLREDDRYKEGLSDLFLGMISLVRNRKSRDIRRPSELYKDFQKRGIYNLEYIERYVAFDYASSLWYWFSKDYQVINYSALSKDSKEYILNACGRIDKKYEEMELNNALMAELCDDMNEHYFKELYQLLLDLRKGLSTFNLLIFSILMASLIFGVLLPFFVYFLLKESELKIVLTKVLIGLNFGLLFFFITNLYGLVKKEITWT